MFRPGFAVKVAIVLLLIVGVTQAQARRRDTVTLTKEILSNVTVLSEDYRQLQADTTGDGLADKTIPQSDVLRVDYGDAPPAFLSGIASFRLGTQYDKALEQFQAAAATPGVRDWLKDYVAYYSAECVRLQAGAGVEKLDEAVRMSRQALAASPSGPLRDGLLYGLGRALLDRGETEDARKQFDSLERSGVKPHFKLGAQLGLAQILMKDAQTAQAVKQYERVIEKGEDVAGDFYADAVVGKGRAMVELKQYDQTARFLDAVLKDTRSVPLLARGYITLGDCHYQKAENDKNKKTARSAYKEALFSYLRVEVLYPQDAESLAKALFYAGKCFQTLEQDQRAQEKFAQLRRKFPNSPWIEKIR